MKKTALIILCVMLALISFGCSKKEDGAQADKDSWPKETVTFVVPYGAGGDTDTYARQLTKMLGKKLNNNFIVVNTTGGAGVVASSSVLQAKPNGYTALFHHTGVMLTQEAAKSNQFSFIDDFDTVSTVARDDTFALVAKADSEWTTLDKMIQWAKANPGKLRYSITNYGATHAVASQMESTMGIKLNKIDVGSGTSERMTAFLAGQCDVLVVNFMNIKDYIENGEFVVLGICAEKRPAGLEKFPTLKEQGYDVVQPKIYEVKLPKGTNPEIIAKLDSAIKEVVESKEFKDTLEKYYAEPFYRDGKTTIEEDRKEVEKLRTMFGQ